MGRKPKRVRAPDRSHAKGKSVAPASRSLHHSGGAMVASGAGSSLGKLSEALRSALLRALAVTPLEGRRWREHSVAGQQGNELPMVQLDLRGIRVHRDTWWLLLQQVVAHVAHLVSWIRRSSGTRVLVDPRVEVVASSAMGTSLLPHITLCLQCVHRAGRCERHRSDARDFHAVEEHPSQPSCG